MSGQKIGGAKEQSERKRPGVTAHLPVRGVPTRLPRPQHRRCAISADIIVTTPTRRLEKPRPLSKAAGGGGKEGWPWSGGCRYKADLHRTCV